MPLTDHERAVLLMERNSYAAMQEARTVLSEVVELMQRNVAARDRRIAALQTELESAYRRIGAQERQLADANAAVAEMQTMNERARS